MDTQCCKASVHLSHPGGATSNLSNANQINNAVRTDNGATKQPSLDSFNKCHAEFHHHVLHYLLLPGDEALNREKRWIAWSISGLYSINVSQHQESPATHEQEVESLSHPFISAWKMFPTQTLWTWEPLRLTSLVLLLDLDMWHQVNVNQCQHTHKALQLPEVSPSCPLTFFLHPPALRLSFLTKWWPNKPL